MNDHSAVITAWQSAGSNISKETPVNVILKSAIFVNDLPSIRELLPTCNDIATVIATLRGTDDNALQELSGAIAVAISNCLETRSDWGQIVRFASTLKTDNRDLNDLLKTKGIKWDISVTIAAAVRVLARSERLTTENVKSQQTISEFLKQHLIIDNNAKPEKQKMIQKVHNLVNMTEIGAAFERAFKLTFVLEYYEQWFKSGTAKRFLSPSPEDVNRARSRWLMYKYQLSETTGDDKHKNEANSTLVL